MQTDGFFFFIIAICIGYFAVRLRLVSDSACDSLSSVLLNVCFPAMVLKNFISTDISRLMQTGPSAVVFSLIFSIVPCTLCSFFLRRAEPDRRALFRYIGGVGNTSFVCIPLLSLFLSAEQMLIVIVHGAVMDILIWAVHHQLFLGTASTSPAQLFRKMVTSPCLIAVVLGIVLCAVQAELPSALTYTIDALDGAVSPLALLLIGMLICRYGLFGWVGCRDAVIYSVLRVMVYPCIVFAVLYWIVPLQTAVILAILFGSPTPVTAVLWCKEYGRDTGLVVHCLTPSTLLYFLIYGSLLPVLTNSGVL